jgi:predicted nucleotidyltransferase
MQDLKELLKRLLREEVDFVLIGGFAATAHGSTLVTQDLDICAAITNEQVTKLRNALKDLHPRHRMNPSFKPSFFDQPKENDIKDTKNLYLETDLGILDILSETQPAGNFDALKKRSIEISIYGHKCRVISIDDLILIKESMKRPKDLQAVQELRIVQRQLKK